MTSTASCYKVSIGIKFQLTSVLSIYGDLVGERQRDNEVIEGAWLSAEDGDGEWEVLAGEGWVLVDHAHFHSRSPWLDPAESYRCRTSDKGHSE